MTQELSSASRQGVWRWYLGVASIALIVLLVAAIIYFWQYVQQLQTYGYLGAFVISLLGSATIIVPVPSLAAVFALGGIMKYPVLVGLVVGLAEPLGELTGYMAGTAGRSLLENRRGRIYSKLEGWMRWRGGWLIFVLSAFPNPFFDVVGALAGSFRYPLWRFLLVCWAGKTIKGMMIAFAGAWGLRWVLERFEVSWVS